MEEVKTEIKQIRNQILVGIKEEKIDFTWGKMIIDTCNKALTLYGVVDTLVCCDNCIWFDKGNCNNENACIDFSEFKSN
jgi:hypothetical protein